MHAVDDPQQEARAVLERAAPRVRAPVCERREELRDEVAVGRVDLHAVEASALRGDGRRDEPADGLLDLLRRDLDGPLEHRGEAAHFQRRDHEHAEPRVDLPAGVADLHDDLRATALRSRRPLADGREIGLRLEYHAARARERAVVDHDVAREQQPRAAARPAAVEREERAVRHVVAAREVFFHRRLDDAVLQAQPARKRQRVEERGRRGEHRRSFVEPPAFTSYRTRSTGSEHYREPSANVADAAARPGDAVVVWRVTP